MRKIFLLVAIATPLGANAQTPPRAPADLPGRYQLFQGNYEFINLKGEVYWNRALFKLDTVTGAVFVCRGEQTDGKYLSPPQASTMRQRHACKPFEEELVVLLQ